MKYLARSSLAAVALVALMGTTGCAGAAQSSAPAGDATQAPSSTADKPAGFTSIVTLKDGTAPADWQGGSGWRVAKLNTETSVFAVGDYLAYLDGAESEQKVTKPGSLIFVDGKGTKSSPVKEPDAFTVSKTALRSISANGKTYLVYTQSGRTKVDPTSVKSTSKDAASVTVFDTEGKVVYTKQIDGTFSDEGLKDDAIRGIGNDSKIFVVDVATGALSPAPDLGSKYDWAGRFDGADIFTRVVFGLGSQEIELTNGSWTVKSKTLPNTTTPKPTRVGHALAFKNLTFPNSCEVFDPHTGADIEGLTTTFSGCGDFKAHETSPDRNIVAYSGGVYSFTDKKLFPIARDINFVPSAVANNGDVYGGSTNNKIALLNINKGAEPKLDTSATVSPVVVSNSGLAAFADDRTGTVFVVKK